MKEITALEKSKKTGLPEGKLDLTETETRALIEHSKKLIRDGLISHVWSVLNIAAACYNVRKFRLFKEMAYDSFEDAIQQEFHLAKTQAHRYAEIGERLSDAFGGGCITQRMIQDRMERDVFESRLGFRQIHTLARTSEGIQRLLTAKSDQDIRDLLDDMHEGADAIRSELESKPKTALKSALSKRYDEMRPPTPTDLNMLFTAVARQIEDLNTKYLSRLRQACRALSADAYKGSSKYPRKAQRVWVLVREMNEMLREIAAQWPDMSEEARRLVSAVGTLQPGDLTIAAEIDRARTQQRGIAPAAARHASGKKAGIPRSLPADLRHAAEERVPMTHEEAEAFMRSREIRIPPEQAEGLPDPDQLLPDNFDDTI
jgi:hypothetical protein